MSEIPKRYEYFLSPDGLRKLTQLMKSHFESYTKKDMMYNDSKGLQYNGSVYNFGSEILLETNKLKMTRPPVRNLTFGKDTTFYFDIKYSDLIDTYDQQNLLSCYIKKDTLINSHQYYLIFNNVTEFFVIRSTNSSAGNRITPDSKKKVQQSVVFKDKFYRTSDTPILVEEYDDENNNHIRIEHELKIKDNGTFPTFYFHYNELTSNLVDSIVDDTLTTIPLTDEMADLPVVWFTTKSFEYLPVLQLENNVDELGRPLLTFATDGNGVSRIYPNCYVDNLPAYTPDPNNEWYIKVESKDGYRFITNATTEQEALNYQIPIKSISIMYSRAMNLQPDVINTITIPDDEEYVVYLDPTKKWNFHNRTGSDYDWDNINMINPPYAEFFYQSPVESDPVQVASSFSANHLDGWALVPGFRIKFLNEYLYKWESDLIKTTSGIHIDSTDERSNNGVIEKNGVSHMMGEFDGLPAYMKIQLDEKIHRSHVELYSIRDHNNMYNQQPMDKQTAGIIIDSAIPQNQLPSFITGDSNIKYDILTSGLYKTVGEILSPKNVLSDIVFVDDKDNTFSDYTKLGMKKYSRFFYHGSNYFSLNVISLDPSTEYGRGYVISNDPVRYENNNICDFKKPARTIARICDIPTSMMQLTNIPNYAPTILLDWNTQDLSYVRTLCNYETIDKEYLNNNKNDLLIRYIPDVIFSKDYNLDLLLQTTGDRYKIKTNLNSTLTLDFSNGGNATMTVDSVDPGSGYQVNDKFKFNIGGRYFTGVVTELIDTDKPYKVEPDIGETFNDINVANLKRESTFHTSTISGSGSGLVIRITIDETVWTNHQPHALDEYMDGLYVYKYDEYNHVWIWIYNKSTDKWDQYIQVTGPSVIPNPYDIDGFKDRRFLDVYMKNLLLNNRKLYYETPISTPSSYSNMTKNLIRTTIPTTDVGMDDISEEIDACNINIQNSYYLPKINDSTTMMECYSRYPYNIQDIHMTIYHETTLPRFNTLNLRHYANIGNRLLYSIHRDKPYSQPELFYYDPTESNYITYNNISTDYYSIKENRKLTYYDLMTEDLTVQGNRYIAPENIYRYNECESDEFNKLHNELNAMSRDEVVVYIRENINQNAYPLTVETTNPFTKKMLVDYCLMCSPSTYSRGKIKMVAQKYTTVAQLIENDDGTTTIVPTGGEQPTGMIKSTSYSIHDLDFKTSLSNIETDILFVFTIMKNDELVSFKHFHMIDENGVDISKNTLLIYNGKAYLFDEDRDTWDVTL